MIGKDIDVPDKLGAIIETPGFCIITAVIIT